MAARTLMVVNFALVLLSFSQYKLNSREVSELKKQHEKDKVTITQQVSEKTRKEIQEANSNFLKDILDPVQRELIANLDSHSVTMNVQMTAYTAWDEDSMQGKEPDGITSTGRKAIPGRTVAVDPRVIPYGSKIYIPGFGWRVAEDTGGAIVGKKIDLLVHDLEYARKFGRKHFKVLVRKNGSNY